MNRTMIQMGTTPTAVFAPADKSGGSSGQKKPGDQPKRTQPGMEPAFKTDPKREQQQQRQGDADKGGQHGGQGSNPGQQGMDTANDQHNHGGRRHDPNSFRGGSPNKG